MEHVRASDDEGLRTGLLVGIFAEERSQEPSLVALPPKPLARPLPKAAAAKMLSVSVSGTASRASTDPLGSWV